MVRAGYLTNGGVADIITVYAVIDPEKPTHRNAGVFIVEKGTPGFSIGRKEKKIGIRRSDMVEPVFDECRVPGENLLGEARVEPHLMG